MDSYSKSDFELLVFESGIAFSIREKGGSKARFENVSIDAIGISTSGFLYGYWYPIDADFPTRITGVSFKAVCEFCESEMVVRRITKKPAQFSVSCKECKRILNVPNRPPLRLVINNKK